MLSGEAIFCLCFFLAFLKRFHALRGGQFHSEKFLHFFNSFPLSSFLKKDSTGEGRERGDCVGALQGGGWAGADCSVPGAVPSAVAFLPSCLLPNSWHSPSLSGTASLEIAVIKLAVTL